MKKIAYVLMVVVLLFAIMGASNKTSKAGKSSSELVYKSAIKKGFKVKWVVTGEKVNFIISAPCKGWVAIGFKPSFMMKDANFIMGYVDNKGKVFVSDEFGVGPTRHTPDIELGGKNNIVKYSGKQNDTTTEISFTIPLNSLDKYDTVLKPNEKVYIILACSDSDLSLIHI